MSQSWPECDWWLIYVVEAGSAIWPSETAAGGVEQSTSTMSKDPITDLQREWTAIARGLDDPSSTEGYVLQA